MTGGGLDFADLLVRSTLLIGAGWIAAGAVGKAGGSAAMRHWVWLLGVAALILLPIALAALPALPILPTGARLDAAAAPGAILAEAPPLPLGDLAEGLYLAVALALMTRLLVGRFVLARLWRKAADATDSWRDLADELRSSLGIRRRVALRLAGGPTMPMTWGALRPKILLPAEARGWPPEQRRIVLLHELAHVGRLDSLSRSIAALASALYWFHPFVWHAARRMRLEQEHACDDLVLAAGAPPRIYARSLLDVAGGMRTPLLTGGLSVAMARTSELERRLLAIIGTGSRRRPGPAFAGASAAAALGLTSLIAAAAPVSAVERPLPVLAVAESSQEPEVDVQQWVANRLQTEANARQTALNARQTALNARQTAANRVQAEANARQAEANARQQQANILQAERNARQAEAGALQARRAGHHSQPLAPPPLQPVAAVPPVPALPALKPLPALPVAPEPPGSGPSP